MQDLTSRPRLDPAPAIAAHGRQFITVVPRNTREVSGFLERGCAGEALDWRTQLSLPDSRKKGRGSTYRIHEGDQLTGGYRLLWIHSEAKQALETKAREQRIAKSERLLEPIACGLNVLG